jgi:hypothetical protein
MGALLVIKATANRQRAQPTSEVQEIEVVVSDRSRAAVKCRGWIDGVGEVVDQAGMVVEYSLQGFAVVAV